MATNAVSIFEAMGTAPPAEPTLMERLGLGAKPQVHQGAVSIFAAQGLEEAEPTTLENIGGFLHDPESWLKMGAGLVGTGAQAADMIAAIPGMLADIPAYVGARTATLAAGGSSKEAALAGQKAAEELVPNALRQPWGQVAKAMGPEAERAYKENAIGWIMEKLGAAVESGGEAAEKSWGMPAEDVAALVNGTMGALGYKGVKGSLAKSMAKRGTVITPLPEVVPVEPVAPIAPTPKPSVYEQVAPEAKALSPEEAIAASKQRIKDIKTAVKAETPAEKAARLETRQYPESEMTWASGKEELPVRVTGEPVKGADGKMYTPITRQGNAMLAPTAELKAIPPAEPQVGLPAPVVEVAPVPQGPGVTPKGKLVEGKTLAELREAPSTLNTALAKVKDGKGFTLSAEEVFSLNQVTRAGGRIVGLDGKPIGPALKQSGTVDPRLLTALGIGSAGVLLAMNPEQIENLALLGLVGTTAKLSAAGEGSALGALKGKTGPYRWNTVEALPENKVLFSKQEVLDRAKKYPTEAAVLERVLGSVEGPKISAHELMSGLVEESAGWKLTPKETGQYADYGLERLERNAGLDMKAAFEYGEEAPPEVKPTTTQWELPEHMTMSDANHFSNERLFGWTRSFEEGGVRHVVEIQSDLAQHAKALKPSEIDKVYEDINKLMTLRDAYIDVLGDTTKPITQEKLNSFLNKVGEVSPDQEMFIADAMHGTEAQLREKGASWPAMLTDVLVNKSKQINLRLHEANAKLASGAADSQLSPILKNWPRQLIRHELQKAAEAGEGQVRFASADTVAKVEGWPEQGLESRDGLGRIVMKETPGKFSVPGHQSIYDRYAGGITRYLKGLGGKEVTDAQGHGWIEVPTKSVLDTKGRIEQVGAADPRLLASIAAAGGVAAYLVANPDDAGKLATLGLLGTVGAKGGKSLKSVLEADLITRVRGGDAAAFAEIYQRTSPTVKRSLQSYEKSGVDVEDVVQRTYEKVYKALEKDPNAPGGFRGDASLETFAYRTAHNLAKNAVRDAKTRPQTIPLDTEIGEGRTVADTLGHEDTPLKSMETQALQQRLGEAMEGIDPSFRRAFEMRELEGMSYEDIAMELDVPVGTVRSRIFRAKEQLQHAMRDYRGKQGGKVNLELAVAIAAVGGGTAFGALTSPDKPLRGAFYGAIAGGLLGTTAGRSALKTIIKAPDAALGLVSTRLGTIAPELKFALRSHELRVLQNIEKANDAVLPFIQTLNKLPKEIRATVNRALLNGDVETLKSIPALGKTYPAVQGMLKSLEAQLQHLGRFKEGVSDYFPRIVKDFEGLKKALGQEAKEGLEKLLLNAEAQMMRKEKRALTDVEQSLIVNRYLFARDKGSYQPGFAKTRRIDNVPEHLQQFYEAPTESLLRYLSGAVNDIEIARFFGKDLVSQKQGKKVFTDVENSIGGLTSRLLQEGKITHAQAMELRDILKARFEGGEQGMNSTLANVRNLTNTGLLGNVASAATQVGDSFLTVYHHGLTPTLQALAETLIGKQKITPKQLGLINHVAEELAGQGITGQVLQNAMKYSGFKAIDMFAKGLNLNAALIKNTKLVSTEAGRAEFYRKYGEAFGEDTAKVIEDLQARRMSPEIEQLAFSELSDAQPISKAEMPEMYLKHPNGRLLYQLKTYMMKQVDVVRRDAYQEIASGEPKRILRGSKNLAALATVYAVSNVPGDVIKDWLSGREADPFTTPKLVENVLQTFGLNRYASQRVGQGQVVETAIGIATPPVKVLQDVALLNPKAISYIPIGGRPMYDRYFGGNERREIYETRLENVGKKLGTGKKLSPKAKAYLLQKRLERKAKELQR